MPTKPAKNVVLCLDGTCNNMHEPTDLRNTNVAKLKIAMGNDRVTQVAEYFRGVATEESEKQLSEARVRGICARFLRRLAGRGELTLGEVAGLGAAFRI